MFTTDLPGDGFEMAVLGCRSLVLVNNNNKRKIKATSKILSIANRKIQAKYA